MNGDKGGRKEGGGGGGGGGGRREERWTRIIMGEWLVHVAGERRGLKMEERREEGPRSN